jgi:pyrroline-5-carboxylate reductase
MSVSTISDRKIAFIGGGNMAVAIISGLIKKGIVPGQIYAVEPDLKARNRIQNECGIATWDAAGEFLADADLIVWAVKPQMFWEASTAAYYTKPTAFHLSIAAGIRCESLWQWLNTSLFARCMPNTPALIGQGITAIYAPVALTELQRALVEMVAAATGDYLWVEGEADLDAVTALSGAGPAYVFYFIEAMIAAGQKMGLSSETSRKLAITTFVGASVLARDSGRDPNELRAQVTSKAGVTLAATTAMDASQVKALFVDAMLKGRERAEELGKEFGMGVTVPLRH